MSLTLLRNAIVTTLATLVMFSFAAYAFAEEGSVTEPNTGTTQTEPGTGTPPPRPPKPGQLPLRPLLNNMQEKRGEIKENMEERKEARAMDSTTGKLGEKREEMKDKVQNIRNKFEDKRKDALRKAGALMLSHIERMQKLIDRIQSRADKLQEKGVDTASAEADLAAAKAELTAAKADLESLKTTATLILNAQTAAAVAANTDTAKPIMESIRTHLKKAHELIRSAVKKLKDAAAAAGLGTSAAVEQSEQQ